MSVTIDWLADPPETDEEGEPKRFYGVATGKVIDLVDPMLLGRVRVQLSFIDDVDLSAWARVATPMSSVLGGVAFLPQVGDEVLVAFEHGDTDVPYVIGSLWNGFAPPPPNLPVPDSPIRTSYMIRTLMSNQILITETPPGIQISSPLAGQTISMMEAGTTILSATGVRIAVGGAVVTIDPTGVKIAAASITLAAASALNLQAPTINIEAAGECTIVGGMVNINP